MISSRFDRSTTQRPRRAIQTQRAVEARPASSTASDRASGCDELGAPTGSFGDAEDKRRASPGLATRVEINRLLARVRNNSCAFYDVGIQHSLVVWAGQRAAFGARVR